MSDMDTDISSEPSAALSSSLLKRVRLISRRLLSTDMLGDYRSPHRGQGLQFADLREYQPGDDPRRIHWPATARTSRVYVKSYQEEQILRVFVALDVSPSVDMLLSP